MRSVPGFGSVHQQRLLVVITVLKVETNLLNRNSRAFRDVKFVLNAGGKEASGLNFSPVLSCVHVGLQR